MKFDDYLGSAGWRAAWALAWVVRGAPAHAQEDEAASAAAAAPAAQAAHDAAFSSWTQPARTDMQRAVAHVAGGYDGASRGATFDSSAAARLSERVTARVTGSSSPQSSGLGLRFEGRIDALRQESSAIDLAIAGGYESRGFNGVPAIVGTVALGHSWGPLLLVGNLGYGRGLEEGEQYGSAALASMYQLSEQLQLGLDSRFRIDLERDTDEPPGERDWELSAGPSMAFTLGSFAIIGSWGMSAQQLRLQPGIRSGVIGQVGLGTAF